MHSPLRLPRVLLTNDDGFEAPGLEALIEVARDFADEVWVVAPQHDESGTGQSLSLHDPLRAFARGERRWAISGTPADCVALALGNLMKKTPPTIVLSGVNAGANLGDDINLSGTIGAAFTGLLLGVPSIAISQDCASCQAARWDTTRAVLPKLLNHFLAEGWRKDTCLSINIPDLPAAQITGFSWAQPDYKTIGGIKVDARVDTREQSYYWLELTHKEPAAHDNSDRAVLRRGEAAVTALSLDRSVRIDTPSAIFADGADTTTDVPAPVDE